MYFFTADHHFGHANIIKYCDRPFKHVDVMDVIMISRWNSVVASGDTVYHLGDFTLGSDAQKYFKQLNGRVYIISTKCHHDRRWIAKATVNDPYTTKDRPVTLCPPLITWPAQPPIVMCHFPLAIWDRKHYGSWHLHANSHGNYEGEGKILDVGVDNHDFYPLSYDEVKEIMDTK